MNRKSLLIVGLIALASVVLAVVGQWRSTTEPAAGALLLPGLGAALNDVERIVVTRAGNETVATLVRTDAGWTVAEKDGYPADVAKLRAALLALAEASIVESKTADPGFYDRLGVEPIESATASGVAVAITAGATEFPVLIVGDEANDSSRYVRRAAEERSFLVDRNPDFERDTAAWLIADIVDVRAAQVQSVTITHADGERLLISKTDAAQSNFSVADVPAGRELSYPGVANVLGNVLRELKLDDVARAADGGQPAVTVEFRTFDGLVVTIDGALHDESAWLSFAARAEPSPATEPAAAADAPRADAPAPADGATAAPSASEQADAINRRVSGWRYRIPAYQYEQLTRHMADLLKAPA